MAATLTQGGELTFLSFPIEKMEEDADGNVYVYGKATDGSVDSDEQIVDPDFSSKAIQDWLASGANVRVQHNPQRDPAGVGVEVNTGSDGDTWVKSLVVEPVAKTLVKAGALRAYSVGIARPKIVRDSVARGGRIVDGQIVEISLVDRPANKNCGIQLVKSDADGNAEWVGKVFGDSDILAKASDGAIVKVDVKGSVDMDDKQLAEASQRLAETLLTKSVFSPTDLAKLLEHRRVAEKRQMDPSVGGGVDRDKIPGKDFAGRNRSFPIVTPGDVSDAASSIGRAGSDNYSGDQLKRNIIRIARRKGDSFISELPESWKKELGISKGLTAKPDLEKEPDGAENVQGDVTKPGKMGKKVKKGKNGKKPFPGAHESFSSTHQNGEHDEDGKPVAKGAKSCPGCGVGYDADSKLRRCTECNGKLPKATVVKGDDKVVCPGCGAMIDDDHSFCPECGKKVPAGATSVEKNHDYLCLGCGRELDKGERFCPGCGKANPGYLPEADSKVKKSKKGRNPGPGAGVVGTGAADIKAVPEHREPDGIFVEEMEQDLKLTDGDEAAETRASEARDPAIAAAFRLKSLGVSASDGALHDLLCPAFHPKSADAAHPSYTIAGIDTLEWQQKALDMAASAPIDEAREVAKMWQHALTLKNAVISDVEDEREEAHKAFKDANVGPGTFPTPSELSPAKFKRPYLTDGHARRSPGATDVRMKPAPTGIMEADDYTRDHIDAGHAADSPSNKGMPAPTIAPAPLPPGMGRTYYRNAQREAAREAMMAMHDHIAQTFPDVCAMDGPGYGGEPAAGARPVPLPVGAKKSEMVEMVVKTEEINEDAHDDTVVTKAMVSPDMVKSAVIEATAPLVERLEILTKALKVEQKKTKKLQAVVDELGAMPDPREAPFKGVAHHPTRVDKSASVLPAGALSVADIAERTQREIMNGMYDARNSHDPAQREAAWRQLYNMSGLPNTK